MLKKRALVLSVSLITVFLLSQIAASQEEQQMDPKAMEAYMKMMELNEHHAYLENFEGDWDIETTAWMQPGANPETAQNSATAKLIFGGRFLQVDFKGSMFGQPFEGLQIIGFDNHKKKFTTFWIDSSSTAFYLTEGSRETKSNIVSEHGLWPDPMTGTDMKVRTVTTLTNKDEYTLEMYMGLPDGTEFKSMKNRSTRKK